MSEITKKLEKRLGKKN